MFATWASAHDARELDAHTSSATACPLFRHLPQRQVMKVFRVE